MVCKFFDKKSSGSGIVNNNNNNNNNSNNNNNNNNNANNDTKQNQHLLDLAALQLAEELHKPIIRKFKKRKVYTGFKDNICGADLTDMQLKAILIKDLDSYYVLLIFLVNMLGLFL